MRNYPRLPCGAQKGTWWGEYTGIRSEQNGDWPRGPMIENFTYIAGETRW
jgi:hypothetical protein